MTESYDNGIRHRRQEVQQAVKNACDQLNADGVAPRDYVEQLAWLFFLKAFDEAENQRDEEAEFGDEVYRRRLNGEYRWASWAGRADRPDEMLRFVNGELWPHLCSFGIVEGTGEFDTDPVGEQIRRIFSSVRNHSRRGASFARVVQQVDRLHFSDQTDVIVLSELYEDLLKRVAADSRGFAGEFYTQRHIIRAMVEVVRPKVAAVNQRRDFSLRAMNAQLSATFVPMAAVDETSGTIAIPEIKTLGELRKGLTPFREDDVIFAKITPCMQNGKSAVARYVESDSAIPRLHSPVSVRKQIQDRATGTSQSMVKISGRRLREVTIPVPSPEEQRRVLATLDEALKVSDDVLNGLQVPVVDLAREAVLRRAFAGEL